MKLLILLWLVSLILAGCAPEPTPVLLTPTAAPSATGAADGVPAAPTAAATPSAVPTATASPAPRPSLTPTPGAGLCSPLEGIPLAELIGPDLLKTRFERPRPGWDEGHHGVDFAYWSRGERKTMRGHPVLAALAGRVAAVLPERLPYGNAVIIETPLEALPPAWLRFLPVLSATPAPTVAALSLQCPPSTLEAGPTALYLLYAHLEKPSPLKVGQSVACGEPIGAVGTTGKSVNDHLHLETRIGPAHTTFESMAHYQNDATAAEMSAYCAWRVSGLFQLMDPLEIFALDQTH